jgi:hypothetical protein
MADTTLENVIRENAEKPARVTSDAGSVEQHSLRDLIEVDRYLSTKEAVKEKRRGLKFNKLVPPGIS